MTMLRRAPLCLVGLIGLIGIARAAERIEFECPEPSGLFPHPVQCDRYFHCRNGIVNRNGCGGSGGDRHSPESPSQRLRNSSNVWNSYSGEQKRWRPSNLELLPTGLHSGL